MKRIVFETALERSRRHVTSEFLTKSRTAARRGTLWISALIVAALASFASADSETTATETSPSTVPVQELSWPQWGGPDHNFVIDGATDLASTWPEDGPSVLWQKPLGGGYSQVLVDGDTLYVTFRRGDNDVAAALDAATGETHWEHSHASAAFPDQQIEFGVGPNATPLLASKGHADGTSTQRLITVGFTGRLHALDPETGKVVWSHDLVKDFGGKQQRFGSSSAPIAYRDMAIVLVGGKQHGAIGFDLETGAVAWRSPVLDISYASPIVIELGGEDQLVFMTSKEIVGVGLTDAKVKWRHPHKNQYSNNCAGPWWGEDGLMFVSSQADGGSRTLRLSAENGQVSVEEIARERGVKIFHNSAVRLGDHLYGASGSFLVAHNIKTNEEAWKERGFPKANLLVADDKALLLDENGTLTLATLTPEKLTVISQAPLLTKPAWTPPTLAGTRLFIRDKEKIVALELGGPGETH